MNNSLIQTNRPSSLNWTAAGLALGAAVGLGIAAAAVGGSVVEDFADGVADGWVAVDGSQQQEYGVQATILTLGWALNAPELPWSTGGHAAWRPQTQQTQDGEAAAAAGPISHSQASWIETTVTGPGPLTFWWKVSSESGYDFLRLYLNGAEQVRISGNVDWQTRTLTLPAGTHQVRWTYTKDGSVNGGTDCGWVDQVQAPVQTPTPPQITRQPVNQTVAEGDDVFFDAAVAGFPTPGCLWPACQRGCPPRSGRSADVRQRAGCLRAGLDFGGRWGMVAPDDRRA